MPFLYKIRDWVDQSCCEMFRFRFLFTSHPGSFSGPVKDTVYS